MKSFLYFSHWFELVLKADNLFDDVNAIDIKNGGENYNTKMVLETLKNYTPIDNVAFYSIIPSCNMQEFVKTIQNFALTFSNELDKKINH